MRTLLLYFAMLLPAVAFGQDYNTAFGVRGGLPYGFTLKHKLSDNAAIEGILGGTRWGGVTLTALYELHANAFGTDGLYWYYGVGAHAGFYNTGWYGRYGGYGYTGAAIGVDGIIGIEYQIQEIPFVVGLDYKPALNVIPLDLLLGQGGLSIRYVF